MTRTVTLATLVLGALAVGATTQSAQAYHPSYCPPPVYAVPPVYCPPPVYYAPPVYRAYSYGGYYGRPYYAPRRSFGFGFGYSR